MVLAKALFQRYLAMFAIAILALPARSEEGELPKWLRGNPDLDVKDERCGVYEWFFQQADLQSKGHARKNEFASMRLISIANKLVKHHLDDPAESYGAEISYLVVGHDPGPFHFQFQISSLELERIMKKIAKGRCDIMHAGTGG